MTTVLKILHQIAYFNNNNMGFRNFSLLLKFLKMCMFQLILRALTHVVLQLAAIKTLRLKIKLWPSRHETCFTVSRYVPTQVYTHMTDKLSSTISMTLIRKTEGPISIVLPTFRVETSFKPYHNSLSFSMTFIGKT